MTHSQHEGPDGDRAELPARCICGRGVGCRIVDGGREPGTPAARADDLPSGSGDLQRRVRRPGNDPLPQLAPCRRCHPCRPARALVRVVRLRRWIRRGVDVLAAAAVAPRADRSGVVTGAVHRDRPSAHRATSHPCKSTGEVGRHPSVPPPAPPPPAAVRRPVELEPLGPTPFVVWVLGPTSTSTQPVGGCRACSGRRTSTCTNARAEACPDQGVSGRGRAVRRRRVR